MFQTESSFFFLENVCKIDIEAWYSIQYREWEFYRTGLPDDIIVSLGLCRRVVTDKITKTRTDDSFIPDYFAALRKVFGQ